MLDGLFEFITLIKDFIMSLINGLFTMIESLAYVVEVSAESIIWMPSFMFSIMSCTLVLIVVFRIVGR